MHSSEAKQVIVLKVADRRMDMHQARFDLGPKKDT